MNEERDEIKDATMLAVASGFAEKIDSLVAAQAPSKATGVYGVRIVECGGLAPGTMLMVDEKRLAEALSIACRGRIPIRPEDVDWDEFMKLVNGPRPIGVRVGP